MKIDGGGKRGVTDNGSGVLNDREGTRYEVRYGVLNDREAGDDGRPAAQVMSRQCSNVLQLKMSRQ